MCSELCFSLTADQGTHWFNILADGSVVGFSAADTDPFNPVVWNWQIISTGKVFTSFPIQH